MKMDVWSSNTKTVAHEGTILRNTAYHVHMSVPMYGSIMIHRSQGNYIATVHTFYLSWHDNSSVELPYWLKPTTSSENQALGAVFFAKASKLIRPSLAMALQEAAPRNVQSWNETVTIGYF